MWPSNDRQVVRPFRAISQCFLDKQRGHLRHMGKRYFRKRQLLPSEANKNSLLLRVASHQIVQRRVNVVGTPYLADDCIQRPLELSGSCIKEYSGLCSPSFSRARQYTRRICSLDTILMPGTTNGRGLSTCSGSASLINIYEHCPPRGESQWRMRRRRVKCHCAGRSDQCFLLSRTCE